MIRKATEDDAHAIWTIRDAAIQAQCRGAYTSQVLDAWTGGELTEPFLAWVKSSFYVAVDGKSVAGSGAINLETGQIDAVFVTPALMGKGVGRMMMAFLENLEGEAGLKATHLDSTLNAAPFYRKCGYQGDEACLYQSPRGFGLDCVPMRKALTPPKAAAQHGGSPDAFSASDL